MRRVPITLLFLVAACGGTGDRGPAEAVVDTVAGVERWSYPAATAPALSWSMDTVGVVGSAMAEDEYQFGDLSAPQMAGDSAGNLYVLDTQGQSVLKYDPDGRYVATFGRRGEGPGELKQGFGLTVGAGDTIWVLDFGNSRLTGFPQPSGDVRSVPVNMQEGIPGSDFAALGDGFLATFRQMFNVRRGAGGQAEVSRGDGSDADSARRIPLIRTTSALEPLDTLWRVPEPPTEMVQIDMGGGRMMFMTMSPEFWPALRWRPLAGAGAVVSDTAAYLLRFLDADGTLRRTIQRAPAPRTTTEADRDHVRDRMRARTEGPSVRVNGSGPGDDLQRRITEQRLEKMTFADLIPRIVALRVDPRNRIWVGVSEEVPDSIARIDVYEPNGTLVGELRDFPMPDVFLGPDRIGILRKDDLDIQQVVLIRYGPADGGG